MAFHSLRRLTLGVPDVAACAQYYTDFGLQPEGDGRFSSQEGGHQLTLQPAPRRTVLETVVAVDEMQDLHDIRQRLHAYGAVAEWEGERLYTFEPMSQMRVSFEISPRIQQAAAEPPLSNGPGYSQRANHRVAAFYRTEPVRPRRLGHLVIVSSDYRATSKFFLEGVGFKLSDEVVGSGFFMRCSQEHHNIFVLNGPADFLHHTGWEVDDVDEMGRGVVEMMKSHPGTHTWGPGRHFIGSNFFWYMKDPAGNYAEYYADMDHIDENHDWVAGLLKGGVGWSLPPPVEILKPVDMHEFMTGMY